jgi:hypothetical protein
MSVYGYSSQQTITATMAKHILDKFVPYTLHTQSDKSQENEKSQKCVDIVSHVPVH